MSLINEFVNRIAQPKKIAIIGDILIDSYFPVSVTRISPEHPIPVFHTPDEACTTLPGGAANVCHQFKNFNVDVALFGFVNGKAIKDFTLHVRKAITWGVASNECQVPVKKRYYDKSKEFPLCRIDIETTDYGLGEDIHQWREQIKKQFLGYLKTHKPDMVICSDYNKGLFDKALRECIISSCRLEGIPTLVDPKKNHKQWKGCTYFKLNEHEAKEFVPTETNWSTIAETLQDELRCERVIITHASKGAGGWVADRTVDARSSIGAGDCFAAIFALAVAHQFTVDEAIQIAWNAGAVYVQKIHNEPVLPRELLIHDDPMTAKIIPVAELSDIIKNDTSHKYVFTNGCFDLIHAGHLDTLRFAKSKGDKLIVALNTDESIQRLKGKTRPLISLAERAKLIAALEMVNYVVEFDEDTPKEILESLKPQVLVKGGDYSKETIVGSDFIDETYVAPLVKGVSTTDIINKISRQIS